MNRIILLIFLAVVLKMEQTGFAKSQKDWFDIGVSEYLASRCINALDPLYQASLMEGSHKDLAHLYLAHCQSVLGQPANAAYNLQAIHPKGLSKNDKSLYRDLKKKHAADIAALAPLNPLNVNLTAYVGQNKVTPTTNKTGSNFYGGLVNVAKTSWSLGLGYESLSMDMTPTTVKDYSQSMIVVQGGYFVLESLRIGLSRTNVNGSTDQMKNIGVNGLQIDYYVTPIFSIYGEYYLSSYPNLVPDATYKYKYEVSVSQMVLGTTFPIYNQTSFGFNGGLSLTSINLGLPGDKAAVIDKSLKDNAQRIELVLSSWFGFANANLTYWTGSEILGIRGRGAVVNNSTERKTDGIKLGGGYNFNRTIGIAASYATENFESTNIVDGAYKTFTGNTMMGSLSVNW